MLVPNTNTRARCTGDDERLTYLLTYLLRSVRSLTPCRTQAPRRRSLPLATRLVPRDDRLPGRCRVSVQSTCCAAMCGAQPGARHNAGGPLPQRHDACGLCHDTCGLTVASAVCGRLSRASRGGRGVGRLHARVGRPSPPLPSEARGVGESRASGGSCLGLLGADWPLGHIRVCWSSILTRPSMAPVYHRGSTSEEEARETRPLTPSTANV